MTGVFVYGLLKRGFSLHDLMEGAEFRAEARTAAEYILVDCGHYPGLRDADPPADGNCIHGEVYEVDSKILKRLDEAEGVDVGLYVRRRVRLLPPFDTDVVEAWFYNSDEFDHSPAGDHWPRSR